MKKEQLVRDKIYWIQTAYQWLIRFKEVDSVLRTGVCISDNYNHNSYYPTGNWGWDYVKEIREATFEEEQHLIACEEARKYVPKKKMQSINYQIF